MTPDREVVTIEPTADTPDVRRMMLDGRTVARMFKADKGWQVQRVGETRRPGTYFDEDEAVRGAGYRLAGTPIEEAARRLNLGATLYAADRDDDTLPCVMVGGVQVYAYIDGLGRLRVSVDTCTSELPERADGTTPMIVCVNDGVVFDDTGDEALPCKASRPGDIPDTYGFTGQFVDRFVAPAEHPHDHGDYSDVQ